MPGGHHLYSVLKLLPPYFLEGGYHRAPPAHHSADTTMGAIYALFLQTVYRLSFLTGTPAIPPTKMTRDGGAGVYCTDGCSTAR